MSGLRSVNLKFVKTNIMLYDMLYDLSSIYYTTAQSTGMNLSAEMQLSDSMPRIRPRSEYRPSISSIKILLILTYGSVD